MLTIKQVDAIRPKDKPYRLLDSNDLYLWQVSGKKAWQSGYKIDGKEKVFSQCREYRLQSDPHEVALAWQAMQLSAIQSPSRPTPLFQEHLKSVSNRL